MYLILLVGLKPVLSAVKEGAPSHLRRLRLMWIVEVLSMCPVALVSRRPDLHVLLSHHAQSPQLSSFAPSWCLLYRIPSCICSVGVHCTVTNYFFSTICSHFCVSGVCFLLLATDGGCGKQFVFHWDLWLRSLTLILVAVLPLITGGDPDPGVLMACFLQKV